jgi:5-amino-6-(5-phosphoribosylamino)uracil reductase
MAAPRPYREVEFAPFFVGDADAPRFVLPGNFPHGNSRRMYLAELRQIGDIALLRYLPEKPAAAELTAAER